MEQASQFRIDRTLLPCRVTKSMVSELEGAIKPLLADVMNGINADINTRIVISDASGDEL